VKHNINARSCKFCCSGKAINITYSECVFAAGKVHAPCYTVTCEVSGSTLDFNIFSYTARFAK
jgi:hypothetical protein